MDLGRPLLLSDEVLLLLLWLWLWLWQLSCGLTVLLLLRMRLLHLLLLTALLLVLLHTTGLAKLLLLLSQVRGRRLLSVPLCTVVLLSRALRHVLLLRERRRAGVGSRGRLGRLLLLLGDVVLLLLFGLLGGHVT